jgi:DnaJ-class molecular chaperone
MNTSNHAGNTDTPGKRTETAYMRDPYTVLGLTRSASEKDIKSAYRRLAKRFHPDQNRDEPQAEGKFAEATNAYDLLSDKEKRGKFDRGEIDAAGNPTMAGFDFSGFSNARRGPGGAGPRGHSTEDILKDFMGGFGGARPGGPGGSGPMGQNFGGGFRQGPQPGADVAASVRVSLEQVETASAVDVRLPNGRSLSVRLPKKVEDDQQIRLKGQGNPSMTGGPQGDALVTVRIARHKKFRREGNHLHVEVPLTLYEAVLGAKVRVPTLTTPGEINLPGGVDTTKALRLKGKGMFGEGDLFVHLSIVLPKKGDPDLESLMRFWRDDKPYTVRDQD